MQKKGLSFIFERGIFLVLHFTFKTKIFDKELKVLFLVFNWGKKNFVKLGLGNLSRGICWSNWRNKNLEYWINRFLVGGGGGEAFLGSPHTLIMLCGGKGGGAFFSRGVITLKG